MKKQILILILLFAANLLQAQSNSNNMNKYIDEWTKLEELNKDDLPKSSLSLVDDIMQKAIKEKNTQQVIKALIFKNKYRIYIDRNDNLQLFKDLENLLQQTSNLSEKSLLHSMIGELYLMYYQGNRWEINSRTELADYIPEDMKEWSKNIFFEKIISNLNQSVENKNILLSETTNQYDDIILLGEDSKEFYPTLYDFLMKRNIEISQDVDFGNFEENIKKRGISLDKLASNTSQFIMIDLGAPDYNNDLTPLAYIQHYLSSLQDRKMENTIIETELAKNEYIQNSSSKYKKDYALDFLLALYQKYSQKEISVDIIEQIVNYYTSTTRYSRYSLDNENVENQTKAYEWCKKGIDMYPNYKRINILNSKLDEIERPSAQIEGDNIIYPDKREKKFKIKYKNLNQVTIKIYKTSDTETGTENLFKEIVVDLTPKTTYLFEEKEINLNIDQLGNYEIKLSFDKESSSENNIKVYVTKLQALVRQTDKMEYEFYVVDRMTGTPVKDATISINKNFETIKTVKTDNSGFAIYTCDEDLNKDYSLRYSYKFKVSLGNDKPNLKNDFPYSYLFIDETSINDDDNDSNEEHIQIFSDRGIYRPGQTVYFKAIASTIQHDEYKSLIKNKSYEVGIYDSNNQFIESKTLKTNEFGSLSGEFILPQGKITGPYYIKINNTSLYIYVEEYKRPTFQITFDKIDKTYGFGDKVTLIGHAENFSGIKLQNALVEYDITKNSLWRWAGQRETIKNDTVRTKSDGSFEITLTVPEENDSDIPFWRCIYSFNVSASVTDINGETQNGNYTFSIGKVSMVLNTNIDDKINKDEGKTITIKASNLDGQNIDTKGSYTLYALHEKDTIKHEVIKGEFTTGKQKALTEKIARLQSGQYIIKLSAKDSNGKDVENENQFIIYSAKDKHPPITTNEWWITDNNTFNENKDAEIILGISSKNVTVLYQLTKNNEVLEREQIKFNNENKTFSIPYKKSYESNVSATFTYVLNDIIYQNSILIKKTEEPKELTLKLESFRDKLRPGQHEEWRISVKDIRKNPVSAEILASMYDSSLDKIMQTEKWQFQTLYKGEIYQSPLHSYTNLSGINTSYRFKIPMTIYPDYKFDKLHWFDFNFNRYRNYRIQGRNVINQPIDDSANLLEEADIENALQGKIAGLDIIKQESGSSAGGGTPIQIRQNFSETAFFYPHLRTNENGETTISFTVPESNTIWKFRALAYDQSFNAGTLEALAVSRKELMVTPNLPRFMRQGDKTSVSTKISNLSENSVSGKVYVQFFDPLTDNIINLDVANKEQTFAIEKDASTSVVWTFEVPTDIELIGCRIIAESDSFSDGEQHAISVLPNRMLVTESMPMDVNSAQTKEFVFDKLVNNQSKSSENYRLTLEYSANPAWFAIQALPTLSNPTNENAVNWFASYYVNTLGSSILKRYPKVAAMITAWKKQGENKESLTSKLQKNEELKSVLLEETPWVLEAKDENEQMQRLSLLFDLNNTKQKTDEAISKLAELQNSNGSWSWMRGFYPSRNMTQYILYGFSELINLGAVEYPEAVKVMQMNAIKYIDEQILSDYEYLKKHNNKWQDISGISSTQLEYLYIRSFYRDIPIDVKTREAERFYTSVVEKHWTSLELYHRSLLSVLARKNGNKTLADKIISSLRERAIVKEDMGMYWPNNTSDVFFSRSAVSVHTFIMEAFRDAKASDKEMNQMKQWLIKQKQTQMWESTHGSLDAIYALLSTGSDWFNTDAEVKIRINNKDIESRDKEAGTGYFKQTWHKSEIDNNMGKVEITKSGDNPSYGAMYWQYYEDLNKITEHKNVLNVDKKLFIETSSDKGKYLQQITENNALKVGDKVVVRLTVRVDRDMDFVHIKDMRAACFEPIETLSGNKWNNNAVYYQTTKDASTNFYFDQLSKGTYVFEYPAYVNRTGEYSNGITTIQCMYAPEFVSHTQGITISVK